MLYPPILANTQPVFEYSLSDITINFTLASVTSPEEVAGIDVFIAQQSDNRSIFNDSASEDIVGGIYSTSTTTSPLVINKSLFNSKRWKSGYLYKVQLRLSNSDGDKSEWSTVMIIKPIKSPTLTVAAENIDISTKGESLPTVPSLNPTFCGSCSFKTTQKEVEEWYRFTLYEGQATEILLQDSGWLSHEVGQDDYWYCDTILANRNTYSVIYEIKTANGYYKSTQAFSFKAILSTAGDLSVILTSVVQPDNARVDLQVQGIDIDTLMGSYVISRTSEKTNFQKFDDIKYIIYLAQSITSPTIIFSDYTVESGITYQYAIQQVMAGNQRSNMVKTERTVINFDYAYLYRDNVQLRMTFNQSISSFKHTVLRNKQDTLGNKYPHLSQNGNAYYAEFQISGLISYQDNTEDFFVSKADGMYYNNELIIPRSKFVANSELRSSVPFDVNVINYDVRNYLPFDHKTVYGFEAAANQDSYAYSNDPAATEGRLSVGNDFPQYPERISSSNAVDYSISTDLTTDNVFIERKFREKVEEFLNDFNYKLYKSPTEGNIAVALMNVSLKPNQSLGRMLYDFSATAYEILDNDLSEFNSYGIINIGSLDNFTEEIPNTLLTFGQIVFNSTDSSCNIFNQMKADCNTDFGDGVHEYQLKSIKSAWLECADNVRSQYYKLTTEPLKGSVITQIVPTSKIFTVNFPSPVTSFKIGALQGQETSNLLINYIGNLNLVTKDSEDIYTISNEYIDDFGQVIWSRANGDDLLSLIKRQIVQDYELNDMADRWYDSENHEYVFNCLLNLDIETQPGAILKIGKDYQNFETYVIGPWQSDTPAPENAHIVSFNSSRIIFPSLWNDNIFHAAFLELTNAEQAIVNFAYTIIKQTQTRVENV